MKFAIHQPAFIPWAGYFAKVVEADVLFIMTGVASSKGDMSNRVKLDGNMLTLPIIYRGDTFTRMLYSERGCEQIIRTLEQRLGSKKNPYRERLSPVLSAMSQYNCGNLSQLNEMALIAVLRELGCPTVVKSSAYLPRGHTTEARLRDFMAHNDLSGTYLSGAGGKAYLQASQEVLFQQCQFPDETFLKVLVTEPDPIDYLRTRCSWVCN